MCTASNAVAYVPTVNFKAWKIWMKNAVGHSAYRRPIPLEVLTTDFGCVVYLSLCALCVSTLTANKIPHKYTMMYIKCYRQFGRTYFSLSQSTADVHAVISRQTKLVSLNDVGYLLAQRYALFTRCRNPVFAASKGASKWPQNNCRLLSLSITLVIIPLNAKIFPLFRTLFLFRLHFEWRLFKSYLFNASPFQIDCSAQNPFPKWTLMVGFDQ